jgi:hypothetical protein
MQPVREFTGYVLGLAFCIAALALCGLAWLGLEDSFGWRWALGGVVIALMVRVNIPVLVGLYLYALNILHWNQVESLAFALPGLLIIVPSMAVEVFSVLVGAMARR